MASDVVVDRKKSGKFFLNLMASIASKNCFAKTSVTFWLPSTMSDCAEQSIIPAFLISFNHFFLYINDLTENLDLSPKLFADNKSLFSIVNNVAHSNSRLSFDFTKISDWTCK